jgi:hypothetical protein
VEPEQLPEQITGFVPDFFFELIARIVPGLVAILTCAYWSGGDFKAAYSNAGPLALLLVAAWVVGVTLDVVVYRIVYAVLPKGVRTTVVPDLRPPTEFFRRLPVWDRRILFKQFALLVFLRGMMVLCAVTGVVCVVMWLWSGALCYLPVLYQHYRRYGVICSILALLFGVSWRAHRVELIDVCDEEAKAHKASKRS